jgi:hypothetical protein
MKKIAVLIGLCLLSGVAAANCGFPPNPWIYHTELESMKRSADLSCGYRDHRAGSFVISPIEIHAPVTTPYPVKVLIMDAGQTENVVGSAFFKGWDLTGVRFAVNGQRFELVVSGQDPERSTLYSANGATGIICVQSEN